MSLDISLTTPLGKQVFDANITHNLNKMAQEAGVYMPMWRPDEIGATKAKHILPALVDGLARLMQDPDHYRQFDAPNGWGTYENLVETLKKYIEVCNKYPNANIHTCR